MAPAPPPEPATGTGTKPRRRYDSPQRRQQAAATRERIATAGAELLHGYPVWNWRALTVRAVAAHAGVNERTVYRHFANERLLHEAVFAHLEREAGVDLAGLDLDGVGPMAAQVLRYVSGFPLEPRTSDDPTLVDANRRQREALLAAVTPTTGEWPERDRVLAAAALDVLWSVAAYERLVASWDLAPGEAIEALTWVIGLVERAVRQGERPSS
jgi:AcrR family transcriptional regulator